MYLTGSKARLRRQANIIIFTTNVLFPLSNVQLGNKITTNMSTSYGYNNTAELNRGSHQTFSAVVPITSKANARVPAAAKLIEENASKLWTPNNTVKPSESSIRAATTTVTSSSPTLAASSVTKKNKDSNAAPAVNQNISTSVRTKTVSPTPKSATISSAKLIDANAAKLWSPNNNVKPLLPPSTIATTAATTTALTGTRRKTKITPSSDHTSGVISDAIGGRSNNIESNVFN